MNIVFLGPPGSGKGTQAKRLADELKMSHLSTGDVFRENISGKTELGLRIKSFVDSGKLVPDALVSEVVFDKLRRSKGAALLLDGYPRTVEQAKSLDEFSKKENWPIDAVISFEVQPAELVERLSARRSCQACKEVFNLVTRRPKKDGVCDACGGTLIQRPDDRAEVVKDRLKVYDDQTAPILDFYGRRPFFHRVNAQQEIDAVYDELLKALKQPK